MRRGAVQVLVRSIAAAHKGAEAEKEQRVCQYRARDGCLKHVVFMHAKQDEARYKLNEISNVKPPPPKKSVPHCTLILWWMIMLTRLS